MLLPLGDSPNPRRPALVTYAILLLNVGVYLAFTVPLSATAVDARDPLLEQYVDTVLRNLPHPAMQRELMAQISAYDLFIFRYGFRPADPSLLTLFASLFLHAGFFHLFGNLLFLWIYGDNVEAHLGRLRYLGLYLGGGVAATMTHAVFDLGSDLPLVGASGAISGVLGAYFVWFPHNKVRLFIWLFPFIANTVYVPARLVLGLYLIVDNLLPFLARGGIDGGGVAYGAHIGGFVAGVGAAWWLDRKEIVAQPAEFEKASTSADGLDIEASLRAGEFERAAQAYFALPAAATRRLLTPQATLELATWLRRDGHPHAALVVFRRHLRDFPRGPGVAEAHLGAGLVQFEDLAQPIPAYQHFLDALDANPDQETAAVARRALAAIDAQRSTNRWR